MSACYGRSVALDSGLSRYQDLVLVVEDSLVGNNIYSPGRDGYLVVGTDHYRVDCLLSISLSSHSKT